MFQIILDLFIAGTETTSVSLDWAMLYMIEYPEIQKKCQEELERVGFSANAILEANIYKRIFHIVTVAFTFILMTLIL